MAFEWRPIEMIACDSVMQEANHEVVMATGPVSIAWRESDHIEDDIEDDIDVQRMARRGYPIFEAR